MLQRLKNNKI